MKNKLSFLLLIFASCLTTISCAQSRSINEDYVDQALRTLSSDEMMGRKVFTPQIDEAARYIAEEFKNNKLSYLPGLNSFEQKFSIFSLEPKSVEITIGDAQVSEDKVFGLFDTSRIEWTNDSEIDVVAVNKEDDFRSAFSEVNGSSKDALVLVDPSHASMYGRYRAYFGRGANKFELGKEKSIVFVLTDNLIPEKFDVKIDINATKLELTNVVGMIEGKRKDEIVLFSGHYDHIGIQKAINGDSIANGANDDASGTAAVMALGKYFSEGEMPERTLCFVAFTAEEIGGYGSQYFSKQLNPDNIVAMFNIEMIGTPAVEGPNTAWITGFDKSNFGKILQKNVEGTEYKFYPDPYPQQNLFYRSDNATLARLGVPAHSISTTPIDVDKNYHQVTDEYETIDVAHMTNTIKAIAKGAEVIVNGTETPTRVDKDDVD